MCAFDSGQDLLSKKEAYNYISRADRCNIWKNCAFDDKILKLYKQSKYTLKKILGYRDIIDLSYEKNGSLFFKMAALLQNDCQ